MRKLFVLQNGISLLALLVMAFILYRLLMVPPIIGVANNGDYWRNASPFGLRSIERNYYDEYFLYLNRKYAFDSYIPLSFYSSQQLLVAIAVLVNTLVSQDGLFDLRVMGGVNAFAFLLVAAVALKAIFRRVSWPNGLILTGLLMLIYLDVGYVSYFNSFYTEPIAYISLLATVSCMALMDYEGGILPLYSITGFILAALLLITSKHQYAPLALYLAFLGGRQAEYLPQTSVLRRWLTIGLPALFLLTGLVILKFGIPSGVYKASYYNAVFSGILLTSSDPSADLQKLDVDPSLSVLSKTSYWNVGSDYVQSVELQEKFYDHISFVTIVRYYLLEPVQFLRQVDLALVDAVRLVPGFGQYEKSTGFPPRTHATLFNGWTTLRKIISPQSWQSLALFYLLNITVGLFKRFRVDQTPGQKNVSELHLCLVVMSMTILATSIIGDGQREMEKHLLLFSAMNDICLFILTGYSLAALATHSRSPKVRRLIG